MAVQPACKAWGERNAKKWMQQWKTVTAKVTRVEKEKVIDQKTEPSKEKAEEASWEILRE